MKVQSGGIVAWTSGVETSSAVTRADNLLSSGGLTVLAFDGDGTAFLSAFGAGRILGVDASPEDTDVVRNTPRLRDVLG